MSKSKKSPKSSSVAPVALVALAREPSEDAVRDYAYHLYEQGGCAPGHDVENWLEATHCLKALNTVDSSRSGLDQKLKGPLVSSSAQAKRELAILRLGREEMESEPRAADLDVRVSLFDNRP